VAELALGLSILGCVGGIASFVLALRSTGHRLAAEQADLARSFEKVKAGFAEAVIEIERVEKRVAAHLEENEDLLERIETKRKRAEMAAVRAGRGGQQNEDPMATAVETARRAGWSV